MELNDLILPRFGVERVSKRMLVFPNPEGKYKALSAELVERALTEKIPPKGVEVLLGKKWFPVRRRQRYRRRDRHRTYYRQVGSE